VLAWAHDNLIRGFLMVRKDCSIEQIVNLKSCTLACPAPKAFAASILSQLKLKVLSVKFKLKYVSSHNSVYRALAEDLYPTGGSAIRTFESFAPEIRDQLSVLWANRGYTPYEITVHPRVSKKLAHSLQQAFVKIHQQSESAALLKDIKINEFEMAQDSNWDDVRDLELKKLSNI
jgi:phosphonate transport system substrate-binding protein